MKELLYFSGRRWPAARVAERGPKVDVRHRAQFVDEDGARSAPILFIGATGAGRAYSVTNPEGWWRDLAEINHWDERRAVSFVERRGDPLGEIPQGGLTNTLDWQGRFLALRFAAMAWDSGEAGGDSAYIGADDAEQSFLSALPAQWEADLGVTYKGLQPVVTAKSLAAYLFASAAASLRQKRPMRRCAFCSSWFTLNHAAATVCSPSCRAAIANKRTSKHGLV